MKPLKGADEGLAQNLSTFFTLNYPDYELIFSVAERDDPAVVIVEQLMEAYPGTRAKLIIGHVEAGPNPKVNNLIRSYEEAQYDWILISDSNVRVRRDYLKRTMGQVETGVGLVTSIVSGHAPEGLGGHLEAVYLNTFYARGMNLADALGHACVVGKSMLLRRSVADRFGGMRNLARYLAEDYMAGRAVESLGMRVVIAADPIPQHIGKYSLASFWARHVRWGRIRKAQAPVTFLFEPLLTSLVSGVFGAIACSSSFGCSFLTFLSAHLVVWWFCDALLMGKMSRALNLNFPVIWLARELSAFPLWVHIASGNTVSWRGRTLKIEAGGLLEST